MNETSPFNFQSTEVTIIDTPKTVSNKDQLIQSERQIAQVVYSMATEWQNEQMKLRDCNLVESVTTKCDQINPSITKALNERGIVAMPLNEGRAYVNGSSEAHSVGIAEIQTGRYILYDASIPQHTQSSIDRVLLVSGTADELRSYLQKEFGGNWKGVDEYLIAQTKDNLKLPPNSLSSDESDDVYIIDASGMVPFTEDELKADTLRRDLLARKDGKRHFPGLNAIIEEKGYVEEPEFYEGYNTVYSLTPKGQEFIENF